MLKSAIDSIAPHIEVAWITAMVLILPASAASVSSAIYTTSATSAASSASSASATSSAALAISLRVLASSFS